MQHLHAFVETHGVDMSANMLMMTFPRKAFNDPELLLAVPPEHHWTPCPALSALFGACAHVPLAPGSAWRRRWHLTRKAAG